MRKGKATGWRMFLAAAALAAWCPAVCARAQDLDGDFRALMALPTKENYLKAHKALVAHPSYDPYSHDLDEIGELLEKGRFREAKAALDAAMPNLLLSPRAHSYYRVAAEGLGDRDEAKRRDEMAQKCLRGIVATGEGVVENGGAEGRGDLPKAPFVVTRPSDEYDVVRNLRKRVRVSSQSLREVEGRPCDVLRCTDETGKSFNVWFDVTAPLKSLSRKIEETKP